MMSQWRASGAMVPRIIFVLSLVVFSPRLREVSHLHSLLGWETVMESTLSGPTFTFLNIHHGNASSISTSLSLATTNTNHNTSLTTTTTTTLTSIASNHLLYPSVDKQHDSHTNGSIPLVSTCRDFFSKGQASCADDPLIPNPTLLQNSPWTTRTNDNNNNSTIPSWGAFCTTSRESSNRPGKKPKQKIRTKDLLQLIHIRQALEEECWWKDDTDNNKKVVLDHPGARTTIHGCTVGIIFPRSLVSYCSCGVVWGDDDTTYDSSKKKKNQRDISGDDDDDDAGDKKKHGGKNISFFFQGKLTQQRKGESWLMSFYMEDNTTTGKRNATGSTTNSSANDYTSNGRPNNDTVIIFTNSGRNIRKSTGRYDYDYYDRLRQSRFALSPDGDYPWTYRFLEGIMCGAIPIISPRNSNDSGGSTPLEQEVGYEYCVAGQPCPFISNETARQEAARRNWMHFIPRHSLIELKRHTNEA
jgi:hypothetical protein